MPKKIDQELKSVSIFLCKAADLFTLSWAYRWGLMRSG
jgi:hypothetical protein